MFTSQYHMAPLLYCLKISLHNSPRNSDLRAKILAYIRWNLTSDGTFQSPQKKDFFTTHHHPSTTTSRLLSTGMDIGEAYFSDF